MNQLVKRFRKLTIIRIVMDNPLRPFWDTTKLVLTQTRNIFSNKIYTILDKKNYKSINTQGGGKLQNYKKTP